MTGEIMLVWKMSEQKMLSSVRCLGLITFLLAMVLSALRLHDTGEVITTLICDDEDFQSAMAIARALIRHTTERYISAWCKTGLLHRIKQGYYEKTQQ